MNNAQLLPVLTVASTSASAFGLFMPGPMSIDFFNSEEKDIRRGYIMAGAWSLATTVVIARIVSDWLPFIIWAIVTAGMVTVYETRMRIWN